MLVAEPGEFTDGETGAVVESSGEAVPNGRNGGNDVTALDDGVELPVTVVPVDVVPVTVVPVDVVGGVDAVGDELAGTDPLIAGTHLSSASTNFVLNAGEAFAAFNSLISSIERLLTSCCRQSF